MCDKVYNNKPKAQIHVRRHFTPTHVCYWCGDQFLLAVELQQHAQVGPTHLCYWCGDQFLLAVELQQHAQVGLLLVWRTVPAGGGATTTCAGRSVTGVEISSCWRWSYNNMRR